MKTKKILILNMMPNTLGDTVLLTPMFKIIKKNYPDSFLAVTVPRKFNILFKNNPYLNEIIEVKDLDKVKPKLNNLKKIKTYLKIISSLSRKIKKKRFDVCLIGFPWFFVLPVIPFLANVKERIGYKFKGTYLNFLLTKEVELMTYNRAPNRHSVELYLDLLRSIGIKKIDKKNVLAEIFLTKEEIEETKKILKSFGVDFNKKIIGFQAISKFEGKTWDYKRYAELANYLLKRGYQIILFGGPDEEDKNEEIRKITKNKAINLSGSLNFLEVTAVFKLCKFVIGNDSGLGHLASASGTNVAIIYGPTNPKHCRPIGKEKVVDILDDSSKLITELDYKIGRRYLDKITVKQVIKNLKENKFI